MVLKLPALNCLQTTVFLQERVMQNDQFCKQLFLQKRVMQNDQCLLPQVSRYTCAEVICDCADRLLMSCVYLFTTHRGWAIASLMFFSLSCRFKIRMGHIRHSGRLFLYRSVQSLLKLVYFGRRDRFGS